MGSWWFEERHEGVGVSRFERILGNRIMAMLWKIIRKLSYLCDIVKLIRAESGQLRSDKGSCDARWHPPGLHFKVDKSDVLAVEMLRVGAQYDLSSCYWNGIGAFFSRLIFFRIKIGVTLKS
jgi:hypothetical protein